MKKIITLMAVFLCLLIPSLGLANGNGPLMKIGSNNTPIPFLLTTPASGGQIGLTGQSSIATIEVSYPNGTIAAGAGTVTEVSSANFPGVYYYTPAVTEDTTAGVLSIHVTDTNAFSSVDAYGQVVAFDPTDPAALGLSNITNAQQIANNQAGLTAQGYTTANATGLGTTNTTVAGLPSASSNATAVWANATRTITGGSLTTAPPTTSQIASALLTTPANLLATDSSGRVILQPSQPGVTIPTVTNVTNSVVASSVTGAVGSVTAAITLPANAPSTFLANDTTVGTINTNTTASAQATDTQAGLTNQGLTTSLASGLLTTNTDVPLIYAKNPAFTPLINSSGYMTATNGGGGGGTDPWLTPLPGAYTAGEAGYIVGNNLNAPISGVPSASSIATAVWSGTGVTIPASHSSSGSSFTLTYRQWLIVSLSVLNGDSSNTAPSASSSATQNYYEIGQPIGTGTLVAQSTATFSASTVISGRTIIFQAQDASL